MKFRIVEENVDGVNLLCPYVVCDGCSDVIRAGDGAIGVRPLDQVMGDVELKVFHPGCDQPRGLWRTLGDWLGQVKVNSWGL